MTVPGSGLVVGEERAFLAAGFGARLRAERKARGLTQRELSAATSIRRQNISRFEHGQLRPRSSTVETLARALRPERSGLEAKRLALDLMAAAGPSLREDRGQRARRRRRALARYQWHLERLERGPAWLAPVVPLHGDAPLGAAPGMPDEYDGEDDQRDGHGYADDEDRAEDEDPAWLSEAGPALSLVRDDPSPDAFTLAMFERWPWSQLMEELRKLNWPDQIAAAARVYGETAEEAEDRLWALYVPPGAPSAH